MSLYSAFDQYNHFSELADPLDTQEGVLSPASRRARMWNNLSGSGVNNTSAGIFGIGTSASPMDLGSTAITGVELRTSGDATTGDTRGMRIQHSFEGAGGSGEALRVFGIVNNVTGATGGTINGAHISMSVTGASGKISGAGNALRATLGVGTGSTPGGTLAALQVDTDVASGVTLPASHAWIRFTDSNSVGFDHLLSVPTVASGGVLAAHTTQGISHSIRIRDEAGNIYYLMCTDTVTNRTGGA